MAKQFTSFSLIVFILNCTQHFQVLYKLSCSLACFSGNLGGGAPQGSAHRVSSLPVRTRCAEETSLHFFFSSCSFCRIPLYWQTPWEKISLQFIMVMVIYQIEVHSFPLTICMILSERLKYADFLFWSSILGLCTSLTPSPLFPK